MDKAQLRRHQHDNLIQSLLLLLSMTGILGLLGFTLFGLEGLFWAALIGVITLIVGPSISPALVMRLYQARPIPPNAARDLHLIMGELARRSDVQPPKLYYIPSCMLNAFAVGTRDQAAIALTDGLLRTLSLRELAGVLAHEVSHVRHNDMRVMGFADVVSRITTVLSQIGLLLILIMLPLALFGMAHVSLLGLLILIAAPHINNLLQLALSRTREYDADLGAVELTGDPNGLASALGKLERYQGGWLESPFLPGRRIPDPAALRTHPPTQERIQRLLSLAPTPRRAPWLVTIGPRMSLTGLPTTTLRRPRWHLSGLWH